MTDPGDTAVSQAEITAYNTLEADTMQRLIQVIQL